MKKVMEDLIIEYILVFICGMAFSAVLRSLIF